MTIENDKMIATLKESGFRSYGKRLYEQGKTLFKDVVGEVSKTMVRGRELVSLTIKGSNERIYVPIAAGVPLDKKSYDIVEYVATEDGEGKTADNVAWKVTKGQKRYFAH